MATWIISGSRNHTRYGEIATALDRLAVAQGGYPDLVVHGGAAGVDSWASHWAYYNQINLDIIGAQWGRYGNAAGPKRNLEMLDRHGSPACTVVAFPGPRSKGTKHMIDHATRRGYDVRVFPVSK